MKSLFVHEKTLPVSTSRVYLKFVRQSAIFSQVLVIWK